MNDRVIRIGGASGFWGDTALSAPQLVRGARIDYLVFDYLAEVTMSILAAQRLKDPAAGYATDFVNITMKSLLPDLRAFAWWPTPAVSIRWPAAMRSRAWRRR
jgi:hypothetical protein